jgi:pyruvate,orthophosphate dikinase
MRLIVEKDFDKITAIFSSYPGILKNAIALVEKLKYSPYTSDIAQEIESHYIKYASYYLKDTHGHEATSALIHYLIEGFQQSEQKNAFLKTILKIILKLFEEGDAAENYFYINTVSEVFEYFYTIPLDRYIAQLGVLKNIG